MDTTTTTITANTMNKHRIKEEFGCGFRVLGFKYQYPNEMVNCISEPEYNYLVGALNKIVGKNNNTNLMLSSIFLVLQFILIAMLVFTYTQGLYSLVLTFFILNAIILIIYIIFLLLLNKKFFEKLDNLASDINNVYLNRNVRLEITKKQYGRRLSAKAVLYYPPQTIVYISPPPMYQQQQQQQPQLQKQSSISYIYSPNLYQPNAYQSQIQQNIQQQQLNYQSSLLINGDCNNQHSQNYNNYIL